MRRRLLWIPAAVLMIIGTLPASAAAQEKKARGTVMVLDGTAVTLEVSGSSTMTFAVDEQTTIEAPGAGTAMRRARSAGQRGVKLSEILKAGSAVEVSYIENNGIMQARLIRRFRSAGDGSPAAMNFHADAGR